MSSRRTTERPRGCGGRRLALAGLAALGALAALPPARGAPGDRRGLVLRNTHTGEVLDAVYWENGRHLPGELGRLDWVLRDHRTSRVRPIDARLYDLLYELAGRAGVPPRFEVISGYRSPETNAMLAATGGGVSTRSLHMEGRALDVRLEGVTLAAFRDLAIAAATGGVGYYPASDFLHLDVGRVRSWSA